MSIIPVYYPSGVNTDFVYLKKDNVLKNGSLSSKFFQFDKILINIRVQKIEKIYDYFILQSICLIDTITSQKPKLKVLKCKYTFGSKAFSYSCKVTLRRRKILGFISLLQFVILSEMRRRHIAIISLLTSQKKRKGLLGYSFSFSLKNTNVFLKLDEFYFKWNYPITFTFVTNRNIVSENVETNNNNVKLFTLF